MIAGIGKNIQKKESFVVKAPFFAGAESKEKGNPCYFQILMLLYYYK
ncbi:hypothetical protein HOLDEFILI_03119 [Holdemania filiformis DSM 12042]|uniref:Uncharacterized protein n=1 Tax=Holdemania filiformis DSM 12042 TaxID=545696 RepID=B9YBB2_9FIRM|nr:hypothetical protein HOLDEFILI_03119 [Holdemania filiformis DSM 12042]